MVSTPNKPQTTLPALATLQSKVQWVCWCFEETKDGRKTKVPYNARNGYRASSTNPKHWSTYEAACRAQQRGRNVSGVAYDGIGFVFNEDCTGIDFDHCINEDNTTEAWAQEWIDYINSYSEISPSGTGVHAIAEGLIPKTPNIKGEMVRQGKKVVLNKETGAAIEMYSVGRFFTVTGHHISDMPIVIEARQEEIETLYAKLLEMGEAKSPAPAKEPKLSKQAGPDNLTDGDLIKKALDAKNGAKFSALWNGDISGYGSQSDADQALCNLLAFWTDKDDARMDRLFRQSGLYRDKWDRAARSGETYGEGTITRAILNCRETYTGEKATIANAREAAHQGNTAQKDNKLPAFIIEGQMREQVQKALEVLKTSNAAKPEIFIYLRAISKVACDENDDPIIMQIDRAALRNALNDAADFFAWKKVKDESILVEAHPPKDLADQILALAPSKWPFPPLKSIVEAPVLRPDGSILDQPGYDIKTRLYYVPSPGMERCKIPTNPSKEDVKKATELILSMFADFPFEGPADLANTIALLFTPFVRHAVKKDIQMALIDATNAGTGKGLITIVVSIVATGKATTPITAKRDDEEWRKSILTELLQAPRIVIIDNIRGVLESATLESMLTGAGVNDRILGQSKNAKPKNEATWMATGNNLLIGGDLPRRCYRIRLVSPTATPEERDDFKIKDLEQWTADHRPEIVSAILTIARAWYVAGKPLSKKVPNLATFTDWAKTIGGMLEFAGIEGFQSNRDELRSRNNEEAQEWEAFLSAWFNTYKDEWKSASDIADDIIKANDFSTQPPATSTQPPAMLLLKTLPQYLKKALAEKPKSFFVVLPIQLGKRVQTVYGTDAYRVDKDEDPHTKIKLWKVSRGVAGGLSTYAGKRNFESLENTLPDIGYSANNHPQPPATTRNTFVKSRAESTSNGYTSSFGSFSDEEVKKSLAGGSAKLFEAFKAAVNESGQYEWDESGTHWAVGSKLTGKMLVTRVEACLTSNDLAERRAGLNIARRISQERQA